MSISRVIIPTSPGVFSAQGILAMNLVHTYATAFVHSMSDLDMQLLEGIFGEMEDHAFNILVAEGISKEAVEFARSLDICYEGQRYYIETEIPSGSQKNNSDILNEIKNSFQLLYEKRYGHLINAPLRTINARLKATGRIKEIVVPEMDQGKDIPKEAVKKSRRIFLNGDFVESRIYEREELLQGNIIHGPAVIEEPFHTTVVMPDQRLHVDRLGNLVIQRGET